MLKYIKHNLDTISGVEIYPIISLLIFFIFFVGLLCYIYFMNKEEVDQISRIPLRKDRHEE